MPQSVSLHSGTQKESENCWKLNTTTFVRRILEGCIPNSGVHLWASLLIFLSKDMGFHFIFFKKIKRFKY